MCSLRHKPIPSAPKFRGAGTQEVSALNLRTNSLRTRSAWLWRDPAPNQVAHRPRSLAHRQAGLRPFMSGGDPKYHGTSPRKIAGTAVIRDFFSESRCPHGHGGSRSVDLVFSAPQTQVLPMPRATRRRGRAALVNTATIPRQCQGLVRAHKYRTHPPQPWPRRPLGISYLTESAGSRLKVKRGAWPKASGIENIIRFCSCS